MVSESLIICRCTIERICYWLHWNLECWSGRPSNWDLLLYSPMVNQQSQILVEVLVVNFGFDRGYLREVKFVNEWKANFILSNSQITFFSVVFHCDEVLCFTVTFVLLNFGCNLWMRVLIRIPLLPFLFFNRQPKRTGNYNYVSWVHIPSGTRIFPSLCFS